MIVVISYRTDCRFVHHGDIYPSHENASDLSIVAVPNEGHAALFIATRLFEEPRTRYAHMIVTSFEGLVSMAGDQLPTPVNAEDPYASDRVWNRGGQAIAVARQDVDYGSEGWELREQLDREADAMLGRIKALVERLLGLLVVHAARPHARALGAVVVAAAAARRSDDASVVTLGAVRHGLSWLEADGADDAGVRLAADHHGHPDPALRDALVALLDVGERLAHGARRAGVEEAR